MAAAKIVRCKERTLSALITVVSPLRLQIGDDERSPQLAR